MSVDPTISAPSDSSTSPSASVDSSTDQVAGAYGDYGPGSASEERERN